MTGLSLCRAAKEQARGRTTTPFKHLTRYAASHALVKFTNELAPLVRLGGKQMSSGRRERAPRSILNRRPSEATLQPTRASKVYIEDSFDKMEGFLDTQEVETMSWYLGGR